MAQPKIVPYTDMVKWIIDNLNIAERKFQNSRETIIGCFKAEDLHKMYHFPDPQCIYDRKYVEDFFKIHGDPADSIKY